MDAGYARSTARTGDCEILNNPAHIKPFLSILHEQGVTDDFLAGKVKALLDAQKSEHYPCYTEDGVRTITEIVPALETQRKTLELATKLKGHLKEQSQLDINVGIMAMVVSAVRQVGSDD